MSLLSLRLCARSALRLCPAVGARASTLSTCKFATIPALHIYQRRAIATSRHTATAAAATPAASASAPADAEPINPEEYAARQSAAGRFTEDDDDSFSGEAPYVDGEPDPARAALKRRLLDAALPLVHEHGWSYAALRGGATALGMSTAAIGLATRGPVELVVRAQELAHEHMLEKMTTMPLDLSTSEQLENAIRFRLEGIVPYLSHWPAALALLAQPCAAPYSIISAVNAIDEIWHYCGDKSTDGNWYSKRALLCGVYLSTELFLVSDRTAGQAATWAFLHRQMQAAKGMAALPAAANDALGYATNLGATIWNRFVPTVRR